jgi:hypothetical protein
MRRFFASTEGPNRLGLRELLQRYADEQWVAAHMTPEQAAASVLDCFKRSVAGELEMLGLGETKRGRSDPELYDTEAARSRLALGKVGCSHLSLVPRTRYELRSLCFARSRSAGP